MSNYIPKVTIHSNRVLAVISKLKNGDTVIADVVEKLDGNYYLISIYGVIFRAYSIVKLVKKAKFKVVSTKPYLMLIPLEAVVKYLTIDDYIITNFNFSHSDHQLVRAIIKSFLKYNLPLDTDKIIIYFDLFKEEHLKDDVLISLLISIIEKTKKIDSSIIKSILKYDDILTKLKGYLNIYRNIVNQIDYENHIIKNSYYDIIQYSIELILENKYRQLYHKFQEDEQLRNTEIPFLINELVKIEKILSIYSDEIESYNYFSIPVIFQRNVITVYCRHNINSFISNYKQLKSFKLSLMIKLSEEFIFTINIQRINNTISTIIHCYNENILNDCIKNQIILEKILSYIFKSKDILLDFQLKNTNSNYQYFLEELEDEYLIPMVNTTI